MQESVPTEAYAIRKESADKAYNKTGAVDESFPVKKLSVIATKENLKSVETLLVACLHHTARWCVCCGVLNIATTMLSELNN